MGHECHLCCALNHDMEIMAWKKENSNVIRNFTVYYPIIWFEIMSVAFMVISLNSRLLKSDGSLRASERVLDGQAVFS